MAKYDVTYVCGHTVYNAVQLFGPDVQRQRTLAYLREQPCRDCLRRIDEERAAEHAAKHGLPPIVGSDKQIAWATVLRYQALVLIDRVLTEHNVPPTTPIRVPEAMAFPGEHMTVADALARLHAEDSARWWIDHAKGVTEAGKEIHLGGGVKTGLGMLTEETFAAELLYAAVGVPEPTTAELAASGDPMAMMRAAIRGGTRR